ncbi:MAG: hypothetical protein AAGA45_02250, partial [Verrucomicrobiota bacterium]
MACPKLIACWLVIGLLQATSQSFAQEQPSPSNAGSAGQTAMVEESPDVDTDDDPGLLIDDVVSVDDTALATSVDVDVAAEDEFNLGLGFNYESEYVLRGKQAGYDVFQTTVVASMYGVSAGTWINLPIDSSANADDVEEVDFSLKYSYQITEDLNVTAGGLVEYYPNDLAVPRSVWGVAFALELESVFGNPTFLYKYKFERDRHEFY